MAPERELSRPVSRESAYQRIGGHLGTLIPVFGVESAGPLIERSYRLLCGESLMFPCGQRPGQPSRLNADGTPFQFALMLGPPRPALQFVAETGAPRSSNAQRIGEDRERIRTLAKLCGAGGRLPRIDELLDELAPPGDAKLLADTAGAMWLGMGFPPGQRPALKIYINMKWGDVRSRWGRLAAFLSYTTGTVGWREVRAVIGDELEPLGVSLVVSAAATSGRMYLSGYGKPYGYYETLGGIYAGAAFQEHVRRYGMALLGEDYAYPTRSVVCSLGIRPGLPADFKVEFCGHCVFENDVQAKARCAGWLQQSHPGLALYLWMVNLLSRGKPSGSAAALHSYLGTGSGRGGPYSTFYFNPAPVAC
jgi:hypothetical protein